MCTAGPGSGFCFCFTEKEIGYFSVHKFWVVLKKFLCVGLLWCQQRSKEIPLDPCHSVEGLGHGTAHGSLKSDFIFHAPVWSLTPGDLT